MTTVATVPTNTSNNSDSCYQNLSSTVPCYDDAAVAVMFSVMMTVTMIFSMFLNAIIVLIVCRTKLLQTTANIFISFLAVSQIVFAGVVSMSNIAHFVLGNDFYSWNILRIWILIHLFIASVSAASYYFGHLLIGLERWLYIARPFLHQRLVGPRFTAIVVVSTCLVAVFGSVDILITGDQGLSVNSVYEVRTALLLPCTHLAVGTILAVVYGHIFIITRRQARAIKKTTRVFGSEEKTMSLDSLKKLWRSVKLMVLVFGTYFFFLVPLLAIQVYAYTKHVTPDKIPGYAHAITSQLAFMEYCSNFFVYANQDRVFRRVLTRFFAKFKCLVCKTDVHPTSGGHIQGTKRNV